MMGIFYKTVFDISVFYTYAAFFFSFAIGHETNPVSYAVFLAAAFLLALSGQAKRNGKLLALVAAGIPAIALLLETTAVGRVEAALLWAYLIFMIKQENYLIYYYHFMEKFKGFFVALILPVILLCFSPEAGIRAANAAIPYLLVFLTAGVMTLQAARHRATSDSQKQFAKFQIFQTVLFLVSCILLTATNLLQTLFQQILLPTGKAIVLFFSNTLFQLISDLFKIVPDAEIHWHIDREGFEEAKSLEEGAEISVEGNAWAEMVADAIEEVKEKDMTGALICLGVILGVIVLIALVGKMAKQSRIVALDVEREDLPEDETPKNTKKRRFFDPEKDVRYQYREFMKKAETTEHEVVKSDTTAEIKDKYNTKASADTASAEQITEVYRQVRYGGKEATKADAILMKKLMKRT